jgi:signal transduction histidine kinase/CheY-like chemotaxis protein
MFPERKASPQARVEELEWSLLERSSVVAAMIVSSSGRLLAANSRISRLLRMGAAGDLAGRSLSELLVDPTDWKTWTEIFDGKSGEGLTVRLRRSDDEPVFLRGDVTVVADGGENRLLGLFVDVTEVERIRDIMQRSARLEALGSLSSGVAHDFNNLLTVLVGNLSLIAEDLRDEPEQFARLKSARDAAKRGSDLIRQLLAFARNQPIEADTIRPARIVANLVALLARALGSRIRLETEIGSSTHAVRGNVAQLESVIVNLAVNARDALEGGGKVAIGVHDVNLSASDGRKYQLPSGAYVRLSVSDNGAGIAPQNLRRVFEPFFSTKSDRGGTGLGLSMVRAYAKQFGGAASIDSTVGQGTTVTLLFPQCAEGTDETAARTMPLSTLPTGSEGVLLFTTEEGLRSTVAQILEVLGYTVSCCGIVEEAAALLRTEQIDLLIIDGMYAETALKLTTESGAAARFKVVQLVSVGEDRATATATKTLAKPFSLADLAQIVRAALDAPE